MFQKTLHSYRNTRKSLSPCKVYGYFRNNDLRDSSDDLTKESFQKSLLININILCGKLSVDN